MNPSPWPALPEEPKTTQPHDAVSALAHSMEWSGYHYDCAKVHAERERILRGMLEEAMGLIQEHNDAVQLMCGTGELEAAQCGYRPYFVANRRRCTHCPVDLKIDDPRLASLRERYEEMK